MSGISMKASKALASRRSRAKKHLLFEARTIVLLDVIESDFSKKLAEVTAKR